MCHLPAKQSRVFTVFWSDSKHSCDVGLGYKTLAGNITKFRDHDSMPMQIELSQLDEGDGLENTLVRCKAHCHKICYDLFNATKLKRAEKKTCAWKWKTAWWKVQYTCSASPASLNNSGTHFFLERILHIRTVITMSQHYFGLDARVRKCATALQHWWQAFGEVKRGWLGSAGG